MKKQVEKSINSLLCSTALILYLIVLVSACSTTSATPTTQVSVLNPLTGDGNFTFYTRNVSVGYSFKVIFRVSDVTNLALWQVSAQFNPNHIECLNISIPANNIFAGKVIIAPEPVIDNTLGSVVYGATVFPMVGVSGSGTLCEAWFKIKAAPPPGQTLTSTIQLITEDTFTTKLEDPNGNPIPFTPKHGTYQYIYPPIPEPIIEVCPSIYVATRRGETFDINITINKLDAQWNLTAIEFKLHFNPTFLKIIEVKEGPFLKQFPQPGYTAENATLFVYYDETIYGYNYVIVGVVLWPAYDQEGNAFYCNFPYGNGTIATITFNATNLPGTFLPVTFPLNLGDVLLLDDTLDTIPYKLNHGLFSFPYELISHNIVWYDPNTGQTHSFTLQTASNSSVSRLEFNQLHRYLSFNATGQAGTTCFCNVTIPKQLLYADPQSWLILVNGIPTTYTASFNGTHTLIHFTYQLSVKYIYIFGTEVIPEFPTSILSILTLTIIVTMAFITKKLLTRKASRYSF